MSLSPLRLLHFQEEGMYSLAPLCILRCSAGFLNLGTIGILYWMLLHFGEAVLCTVHCRLFTSILGLCPLTPVAPPMPTTTSVISETSLVIVKCPLEGGQFHWWCRTYLGKGSEISCLILEVGTG